MDPIHGNIHINGMPELQITLTQRIPNVLVSLCVGEQGCSSPWLMREYYLHPCYLIKYSKEGLNTQLEISYNEYQ